MADGPALLEVGRITRAHGLRGELIVDLLTDREERLDAGSVLQSDRGQLVVREARPYQQKWLVTFEGISDRTAAEKLHGTVLRAEPIDDPEALWVHDLIGARVVERDGTARGVVVAVEANPAHDLLLLDTGAIVPVVFVADLSDGVATVDVPEGLFDLFKR
ncbi:MAG: ribosome maturation factor RimM [Acidimicrobiia bacterium]